MEVAAPAMLAPSSLGRRQHGWRPPPATSVRVRHGGRRTAPERLAPSHWMTAPATLALKRTISGINYFHHFWGY
uniref:Uncharacterized protein n=1 Tax=Oryza nivara TaxID=4536 RepID=A0A0E0FFK3_ORYNI